MDYKYCPYCGESVNAGEQNCRSCHAEIPLNISQLKVPLVSVFLSALFPGFGQVYNGDSLFKGLLIFFGCVAGSFFFLIPGLVIWIYGMYDAYSVSEKMNKREIAYKETKNRDLVLMILIPLIFMLILMFISIYVALMIYGSINQVIPGMDYLSDPQIYINELQ
ncbi:zinc ribbon domain-containing protein [Methanoplanus sp. FWC-SCC4]|uniref:Zinc ribbon domain-containing protein n=1 Tax=Methanochimaera problematica TaxID=2609417 RepID=A0AA97FAY2_9EURY|nr:zinc ribbon domain-containing protein [Methanoplanus sp. FWC-SCC4]WOF15772.1 zinc ribbon domain-containing protein [Methanoplanus sp. FWC-SCC4]